MSYTKIILLSILLTILASIAFTTTVARAEPLPYTTSQIVAYHAKFDHTTGMCALPVLRNIERRQPDAYVVQSALWIQYIDGKMVAQTYGVISYFADATYTLSTPVSYRRCANQYHARTIDGNEYYYVLLYRTMIDYQTYLIV